MAAKSKPPASRDLWGKWFPRVVAVFGMAIIASQILLNRSQLEIVSAGLACIFGSAGVRLADIGLAWWSEAREIVEAGRKQDDPDA